MQYSVVFKTKYVGRLTRIVINTRNIVEIVVHSVLVKVPYHVRLIRAIPRKKCQNNVGAHALMYLLNSCVSTHKQRRDCGHVAARIAQTESKTASIHVPEGLFL